MCRVCVTEVRVTKSEFKTYILININIINFSSIIRKFYNKLDVD